MKTSSSREEIKKIAEDTIEPCDCKQEDTPVFVTNVRNIRNNNNWFYLIGVMYLFLFLLVIFSPR